MLPFVKGKDYRALEPRRIEAAPDVVLDVVVGDELVASLQRAFQELLLNMSRQTSIESATHNPPCGNAPESTQDNSHIDSPKNTPSPQGPQASACHSQDNNNGNTIDTQRSEATGNATQRLDDPPDETAAKDMTLMQTKVHASQGDVQAQIALGDRYKDDREVDQNNQAEVDWYLRAAEQGHHHAQYNLGLLYEQGQDDVPQDHAKVFEWYLKSALQGYADAQAKVSQAYTDGAGVPKDNFEAMEWLVKAAENGHAGMQCSMGAAYEKGHGVFQSNSISFEWYLKSADQGFAEAQA